MTLTWSPHLRFRAGEPEPVSGLMSGGIGLDGSRQDVESPAGRWRVPLRDIPINRRESVLAYRAMVTSLKRGQDIILPIMALHVPRGAYSADAAASLSADAFAGTTQIAVSVSGMAPEVGHFLSIGGNRLHVIEELLVHPPAGPVGNTMTGPGPLRLGEPWSYGIASPAAYIFRIWPMLRATYGAGAALAFKDLRLRCRIEDPAAGALDLDLGRRGFASLTFIEA